MAIANPRIHIICGICGSNKDFKYNISEDINDDTNEPQTNVTLVCNNCSSITGLDELMEDENKKETHIVKSKYLVRPSDYHVWELDESNGCYRSYSTRGITYLDGTRPNAQLHFTFENLTKNYDFFPIDESDLQIWEDKNDFHNKYILWKSRSDGHGGSKGGTFEEFLETL